MVADREEEDHGAVPGHAQRRDLQEAGEAVEAAQRQRQDPLHPRGGAAQAQAHGGLPRLQVPAEEEGEIERLQAWQQQRGQGRETQR